MWSMQIKFLKQNNINAEQSEMTYTLFRKKHPLTFSFISVMCRYQQKLQWIYVRQSPQKIAMLRSATFAQLAQLSRFRASAQFLPRSATFAQLWLILGWFLRFSSILETFWGKIENGTFEHPQSFRICSCLPENCDFLTPYFFHPMPLG